MLERETVEGDERARRRREVDMQAKVIRSSLQGTRRSQGMRRMRGRGKREGATRLLRIAVPRPWGPWSLRNQWPYKQKSPVYLFFDPFLLRLSVPRVASSFRSPSNLAVTRCCHCSFIDSPPFNFLPWSGFSIKRLLAHLTLSHTIHWPISKVRERSRWDDG